MVETQGDNKTAIEISNLGTQAENDVQVEVEKPPCEKAEPAKSIEAWMAVVDEMSEVGCTDDKIEKLEASAESLEAEKTNDSEMSNKAGTDEKAEKVEAAKVGEADDLKNQTKGADNSVVEASKPHLDADLGSDCEHERRWEEDRGCSPPCLSPLMSPGATSEKSHTEQVTLDKTDTNPKDHKIEAEKADAKDVGIAIEQNEDKAEDDCMIIGELKISRRSRRAPEQSLKRERLLQCALGGVSLRSVQAMDKKTRPAYDSQKTSAFADPPIKRKVSLASDEPDATDSKVVYTTSEDEEDKRRKRAQRFR